MSIQVIWFRLSPRDLIKSKGFKLLQKFNLSQRVQNTLNGLKCAISPKQDISFKMPKSSIINWKDQNYYKSPILISKSPITFQKPKLNYRSQIC